MVSRWLAALIAAASMAFAPVALDACQSTCASHDEATHADLQAHASHHAMAAGVNRAAHDHTAPTEHSCHHADAVMPSADGPGIAAVPHTCGHSDEIPPTSAAGDQVLLHAPAIVPVLVSLMPRVASTRVLPEASDVPDAIPLLLAIPLRV